MLNNPGVQHILLNVNQIYAPQNLETFTQGLERYYLTSPTLVQPLSTELRVFSEHH